jgi:phosphoglycerate-specific signal transduction histidine kinase
MAITDLTTAELKAKIARLEREVEARQRISAFLRDASRKF